MEEIFKKIKIKKGLRLPINGAPKYEIEQAHYSQTVALLGPDYVGMKPTMFVKVNDYVRTGQPIFADKKNEGVVFTAPATGKIIEINRGAKRAFLSIKIEQDGNSEQFHDFETFNDDAIKSLSKDIVTDTLVKSGLWTALRTRPFSKTPRIGSTPSSIFVTAIDTNPLAPSPSWVIMENMADFHRGIDILNILADGKVFLCRAPGGAASAPKDSPTKTVEFDGPHPAGLVGTHIHYLDPVSEEKSVFHIGYHDVIGIGKLFSTGQIWNERLISLGGPLVKNPKLLRTQIGASLYAIVHEQLKDGEARVISGSVFSGRHNKEENTSFLGRFHNQVTVIEEGRNRELLGWHMPGLNKFSVKNLFLAKIFPNMKFDFTTNANGSKRAMVPIGMFESVLPLDIIAPYFLRSLISKDSETAQALGALELDEEDLSLCTFVCPGKTEYGPLLRDTLVAIEKEGL